MGFRAVLPPPPETQKSDKKSQFENRLRLIKELLPTQIKKREGQVDQYNRPYTAWRLMSDLLVVRAYKDSYSLHTNGDLEHYEYKKVSYNNVKYEVDNLQFIANLLDENVT